MFARYLRPSYYMAPLEGGYFDSDDVPSAGYYAVKCRECPKPATLPKDTPRFCSIDCCVDYIDPDRDEHFSSEYLKRDLEDQLEEALASDQNPLFELMRTYRWRGLTFEAAVVELERMLRQ